MKVLLSKLWAPLNCNVAPAAEMLKAPPTCVPPLKSCTKLAEFTLTMPVLLKGTEMVKLLVPVVRLKVPLLLNAFVPPLPLMLELLVEVTL